MPLVYDELRQVAAQRLGHPKERGAMAPTEVVHEVYLRLGPGDREWAGRTHFFAVSARAMRHILVDEARRRNTDRRGGGCQPVTLHEAVAPDAGRPVDVLALDEALHRLASLNARQAEVVELRFFGGLSVEDCALVLHVSRRTVLADWSMARAWLKRELSRGPA